MDEAVWMAGAAAAPLRALQEALVWGGSMWGEGL